MADHKVVIMNTWDSNLVHLFDMTDGKYSAIEFNEYTYIDEVYRDNNGQPVVDFDDDGSAVISHFLDGKGVKVVDNKPGYDKGADALPALYEDRIRRPFGPDTYMSLWAGEDQWSSNAQYERADGTVLLNPNTLGINHEVTYVPPGESNPVTAYWNTGYGTGGDEGLSVDGFAAKDGFLYLGMITPNPWAYPQRRLILKVPPKTAYGEIVTAAEVIDLGVANTYEESLLLPSVSSFNFLPDGTLVLDAGGDQEGYYRLDGTTLNFVVTPGVIGPISIMNQGRRKGLAKVHAWDWFSTADIRDMGLNVKTVETANLVVSSRAIPAFNGTYFPASEGEIWGDDDDDGDNLIIYTYAFTPTGETEPRVHQSITVIDLVTGVIVSHDFTDKVTVNAPCPLAELDIGDMIVENMPAYQLSGTIELDGSKVATQLIVMENVSMRIVGRTKADPVTGAYSIRCWTPGKKSVFAQHPVSKGLRLAAELTPVLVP